MPVSFTHACVYARNPMKRNKTDEEIQALAARGGVMGINAVARLMSPEALQRGSTMADLSTRSTTSSTSWASTTSGSAWTSARG